MGQEEEKAGRLKSFAGYQVDNKVGDAMSYRSHHSVNSP